MAIDNKWRGYLVIVGGVLVQLTLGTVYSFGNMTTYITSYLRAYGHPDLSYADSIWIFATTNVGQGLSMFFGGILNQALGPRLTALIGSMLLSAGVLLTYFTIQHSFTGVVFTYGLMFGLGVGIVYPVPIASAMRWMPKRKGLVTGCVVSGFGAGAFIVDQVQTAYINRDNEPADEHVGGRGGVGGSVYFTQKSILDRVPSMFLVLGVCYIGVQIVGSLLIVDPPGTNVDTNANQETEQVEEKQETSSLISGPQPEEEEIVRPDVVAPQTEKGPDEHAVLTPREVLRQKAFYILWFIFLFNGQSVVFFQSLYKAYGQTFIKDDVFLAFVGSVASVFNAGGRIAWGYFADRASFKVAMTCLCCLLTILMLTIEVTSLVDKALYAIYVWLIFGTLFGIYSLFPVATARSFGQRYYGVNYGLLWTEQIVQGIVGGALISQFKNMIHWYGMFFMMAGFSFTSLILMFFFRLKNSQGKDV